MIGDRKIITARYYNANYYATVIVASITTEGIDWSAYIGGADYRVSEKEAVQFVAERGCKLPESDARHYFPDIVLPYRR